MTLHSYNIGTVSQQLSLGGRSFIRIIRETFYRVRSKYIIMYTLSLIYFTEKIQNGN